jgi:potassium-transporting ATPase KdpC subunit
MMIEVIKQLKSAFLLLLLLTILTGLAYPYAVTVAAQYFFPWKANGSLIFQDKKLLGSYLIGQYFTDYKYFWGRPSATLPFPYNALASTGSNYALTNPSYLNITRLYRDTQLQANPYATVPVDLVTSSASGLDPEITASAAFYQVHRIAKERHLPDKVIYHLIRKKIKIRKGLGLILNEVSLNVLELNMALDSLSKSVNSS